jgi:hypothetical protein
MKTIARKNIENTGMSLMEYAKDCLRKGLEYSQAVAEDLMTFDEKKEFHEYKTSYYNDLLKDCPF